MNLIELWTMLKTGSIDFVGQKRAFDMQFYVIWASGIFGFIHGFLTEKFLYTFYWVFTATLVCTAVCLPAWPWWNRNPVNFLKPMIEKEEKPKKEDKGNKGKSTTKKKDKSKD
mmetsp:Transcript_116174/g.182748  ORF Transcript_116174/g.182748 Transcript_116174/m.182748 type:complete len:113 (+) Transcript_116174:117-455(+)